MGDKALRMAALAAMLAAVAGCGLSPALSPEETLRQQDQWRTHMDAGREAREGGRVEEAERELLAAVGSLTTISGNEGRFLQALNILADVYAAGNRLDSAEQV